MIEQLEIIIDRLLATKTKIDIVLSSVEIPINISQYFVYILSFLANKSQLACNMYQDLSKTSYNDQKESVSIAIRFSSKNYFLTH